MPSLLYADRRTAVGPDGLTIGRAPDNDVVIAKHGVSRHHARISSDSGAHHLADLGSKNDTQLNGERLNGATRPLFNGDVVLVGGEPLRFVTGEETGYVGRRPAALKTRAIPFGGDRLTIGRDASNDVALDDPNVSRFHAEIVRDGGQIVLRDLASRNGTRVDGRLTRRAALSAGSAIGIGAYRLLFDGTGFVARPQRGTLRLDAQGLTVRVKGKQILAPTSLSIEPGELVAIIGESGSGKSTLIKALAGVNPPSAGTVSVGGEPVAGRETDIGYLPQDEIVHGKLSVREALDYAARLRLPHDTAKAELAAAVARVLDELGLSEHAETRIESLSGGQRKRVGLAVELLGRPSLLFLDEPTTGLDPELETRMMALMRDLAGESRAVVVVTHATRNLGRCDRIVVMGRGGELCFQGPPDAALGFFGAESYDEIYARLESRPAAEWRRRFAEEQQPAAEPDSPVPAPSPRRGGRPRGRVLRQAGGLAHRYVHLLTRDRRNMLLLLGQVPLLALAIVALFNGAVFGARGEPNDAVKLVFLVVTTAIWLGAIDSTRELVKEKSVFVRETAVGVRVGAYLLSKAAVLFALAAVQSVLLGAIVFAFQPLHAEPGTYAIVLSLLVLTAFAAVGMGLLMSAVVRSQDQATSLIPLVLIPQLFFGGSLVPVAAMSSALASASKAVVAQWSYAGVGSALDLNAQISADRAFAKVSGIGTEFFDIAAGPSFLVLTAFVAVAFAGVAALLRRVR